MKMAIMESVKKIFLNGNDVVAQDPPIIQEIRELYDYVRLLGQHVKLLHNRLEQIETVINEVDSNHNTSIQENSLEIAKIREHVVQQVELNEVIQKMTMGLEELAIAS
jgi:rRNA maturation endonuclease Nob1